MPKENITCVSDRRIRLEVRWNSDPNEPGPVQVATVNTDLDQGEQGSFANLDRDGLNRAIYAMRRARDQAYGADA